MTAIGIHSKRADELYNALAEKPYLNSDNLAEFEKEHSETLVVLAGRLASANALRGMAPAIQAILDRRMHSDQLGSNEALRTSMENVSSTLLLVEENQRKLERTNQKLARAAVWLGVVQVIVALITANACQAGAAASRTPIRVSPPEYHPGEMGP